VEGREKFSVIENHFAGPMLDVRLTNWLWWAITYLGESNDKTPPLP
jgi:hypothetical protein